MGAKHEVVSMLCQTGGDSSLRPATYFLLPLPQVVTLLFFAGFLLRWDDIPRYWRVSVCIKPLHA